LAPLLNLVNASAGYGGRTVLRDVTLALHRGERVSVLGKSGSGKSTLLGLAYAGMAAHAALVPQAAALVRPLSVFHNVYMGRLDRHSTARNLLMLAWPRGPEVEAVRATLGLVGLSEQVFARAGALSGGQQQRVSVARALYNGRPVVVGDEPVSALDPVQAADVLGVLASRHDTLLLAMHDVDLALRFSDRILVLEGGRLVLDAPAGDVSAQRLRGFYT